MIRLGVNIDHVATVRQARRALEPDPVAAAVLALLGGADGITAHLREDRRHIQDRDVRLLRPLVTHRLNLEMAAVDAIVDLACEVRPNEATLVPERREELTTEGGLDVVANQKAVGRALERLKQAGIEVSLFVDPDDRQIEMAKLLGAAAVEIQTARYSEARTPADREREARPRRRQDRPDPRGALELEPPQPPKILQAGALEVAEVDDVVDVAVRVHLAPEHGELDHHRIVSEQVVHGSPLRGVRE